MRRLAYAVIAIYAAFMAWVVAAAPWSSLRQFWTSDDAYFYLTIARNIARGLGSTFDGLSLTNGYQPLWLGIVAAVYCVTGPPAPEAGARVAIALASVCAIAGMVVVVRLLYRLGASPQNAAAAVVALLSSFGFWFFGLEAHLNVLTGALFLSVAWKRWEAARVNERGSRRAAVPFGVLGSLLVLTRVDLVIWVAVVLLALSARRFRSGWPLAGVIRLAAVEQGVASLIVLAYLAFNRVVFGAWMPISAILRSKPAGFSWSAVQFYHPIDTVHALAVLLIAMAMAGVAMRAGAGEMTASARNRIGFGGLLAACVLVHSAAVLLFSVEVEPRYLIMSSLAAAIIAVILLTHWTQTAGRRATLINAVVTLSLVVIGAQLVLIGAHRLTQPGQSRVDDDLERFRGEMARLVPPNAIVFVVDLSGEIAWFCDCRVINGDGLVNDWRFQQFVAARRVADYLKEKHVAFVVSNAGDHPDGVLWINGYDWIRREEFRIVGYAADAAIAAAGQFRLFRFPDGAITQRP